MRNLAKKFKVNFIQDRAEYFGIVGAISITISILISYLINLSVNPNFNITTFAVSELGTGPKISSGVYGTGLLIASFCQIPLYISVINYLRKKECPVYLIKIVALSTLFLTISHNILTLVPFERVVLLLFLTHGIAAAIHYVAGSIAFIFYGFIELLHVKVSKILVITSFITGILYGILWIGYLLDFIVGIPEEYINHTIQWFGLAGIILWSLFHSIFLFNTKKQNKDSFN